MDGKDKKPEIRFAGFTDAWEQRKLVELATELVAGGDIDKGLIKENGKYPVIANALTNEGIVGFYDKEYRIKAPAVTITGRGDVGHAKARKVDFTPVVRLVTLKSKHDVDFIENAINRLNIIVESTGVPQLTVPQLGKYELYFPNSSKEEKAIGKFFKKLDDLITLHQRKCDKLIIVKKSMLEKMFPKEEANIPEIRFSGFTDAWEQCKLSDVVDLCSGRDYKHLSKGNVPVYGTGGYMLSVNDALSYDKDAIGIGRKGTIDKPYILKSPFWTVDTLFYAVPRSKYNLDFLYGIFQNIDWKQKDESTGVPSLSKITINSVEVKVAEFSEQKKIGLLFIELDNLITLHQRELEKLKNIKKSMLEKMFI